MRGAGIQLQPAFLIADELASAQFVEVLPNFRASELAKLQAAAWKKRN